ncbi:MAG: ACP phosphodiesterase [Lentimicrobiaceae bacterium]|nr:ACP phosphodiesterase [Lentimicrobiaceae bacterium]
MNFLAHLYLSGNDPDIIIGNFIADHVKGRRIEQYSAGIRAGIQLHRDIDEFTDSHPVVKETVLSLRPLFHKYAGVVVDMYFDHFLAAGWDRWSEEPLKHFTMSMYHVLMRNFRGLPPRTRYMLPFMLKNDWLFNYSRLEGLHRGLSGMAKRTSFPSGMEHATDELRKNYGYYQGQFDRFFPALRSFANSRRQELMAY